MVENEGSVLGSENGSGLPKQALALQSYSGAADLSNRCKNTSKCAPVAKLHVVVETGGSGNVNGIGRASPTYPRA